MATPFSEGDWSDLLDIVDEGRVIPIVGELAVTRGSDDNLFYPEFAGRLAASLGVPSDRLPANFGVHEVVQAHYLDNEKNGRPYLKIRQLLKEAAPQPGDTLLKLAAIRSFRLYLSTTFDELLANALEKARGAAPNVLSFFPNARQEQIDLPTPFDALPKNTVYHLMGKSNGIPGECAIWDGDRLEYVAALPRKLGSDLMRNLSNALQGSAFLFLGLNWSDWIARMLLQHLRQIPLSKDSLYSWLAEPPGPAPFAAQILFFGSVNPQICVLEQDPRAFVDELSRRWIARHPAPLPASPALAPFDKPIGLVFLSYCREDEKATLRIKAILEQAGCTVYMDLERLRGGQYFNHELEDQVKKYCAVFISVISQVTEAAEGQHYFGTERDWAAYRLKNGGYSDEEKARFYRPFVILPGRPRRLVREPRDTEGLNWTHCPEGELDPDLAAEISAYQKRAQQFLIKKWA